MEVFNGEISIKKYVGSEENVQIPAEINGKPITEIDVWAFKNCAALKNVIISKFNVYARKYFRSFYPDVVIAGGKIYNNEFRYEETDSAIELTRYIGDAANVTIPAEIDGKPVEIIGISTFYKCNSVVSVKIPESVVEIGDLAFYECDFLAAIKIPASVTKIGADAFSGCESLKIIEIPAGVNEIEFKTFKGCRLLKSIFIPKGSVVAENAFDDCSAELEKIYY